MITEFAPAERSSQSEIEHQVSVFASSSAVRFADYIPNIVLVMNRNRQIVFANKAAEPLLETTDITLVYGLRQGELMDCVHSHESEGGCGTTDFCSQCGAVKAILSSLRGEEDIQECRITRKNTGEAIDLRVWTYPILIEDEPYVFFVAVDISNEKRREILERIFLHDIMNSAGNIKSFAEILKEAQAPENEEFRELIHELSSRLIDEINAHRELIAAENQELIVHPVKIKSLELLEDIRDYYKKSELGKNYRIELDPESQETVITGDRILLGRVLGNMLKNALEASVPGDVITLGTKISDDEIEFSVHNPGYIPHDVQLQIFQRSFSTKGVGRGMGTYGMRLLSERYLRGNVSFSSSESEGTTFIARYPLNI